MVASGQSHFSENEKNVVLKESSGPRREGNEASAFGGHIFGSIRKPHGNRSNFGAAEDNAS